MASFTFKRGDPERPIGHAFLCFGGSGDEGTVAATYLVVPPIAIDFAKYIPPLIASSLGSGGLIPQASFLPVPPAPEECEAAEISRLAELRGDDVLEVRGAVGSDLMYLMTRVAEIGDEYARAYHAGLARAPESTPRPPESLNAMALLYSILTERERLDELARGLGKLRYAVEGGDAATASTTVSEMQAIAAYLPERFRARELIEAAARPDPSGARLAQLYVERGYKLCSEEVEDIPRLDDAIEELRRES